MRDGNKIIEFWGDRIIWHGKLYSQVTLKSLYTVTIIWCVCKMFSMTNHKMVVTNMGQYIAQVFWLTRRSTQQRQRKEPALQAPVSLQAQYWLEWNAINKLSSA